MMIGECLHKCTKKRLLLVHGYVIRTYGGSEVILETELLLRKTINLHPLLLQGETLALCVTDCWPEPGLTMLTAEGWGWPISVVGWR